MASRRLGIIAGGALAGTLLLATAGLVLAQDPTPSPSQMGPGMMGGGPGVMGGQMGAGMMGGGAGAVGGMMGGQMGAGMMTAEQLEQMEALHDQMVARWGLRPGANAVAPRSASSGQLTRDVPRGADWNAPAGASTRHPFTSDPQRPLTRLSGEAVTVAAMKPRTLALLVLAGALLITGCAAASPPTVVTPSASLGPSNASAKPSGATTRTSDEGQVTVVVDWAGPAVGAVFDVTLDTHSVDLDALDLADAILRNDQGETMPAQPWAAPMGGHHRDGALTFDGDAAPFFAGSSWIELVLSGIGDIPERTLRWEIGS